MYQIYDTAITHQYAQTDSCVQRNIRYLSNLVEYCFWGIEFYNKPPEAGEEITGEKYTRDIHIAYNVLRKAGWGWGSIVRYRNGFLYCSPFICENEDELTEYNIYDRSTGPLIHLSADSREVQNKNIYIQHLGGTLGRLREKNYTYTPCDSHAPEYIRDKWGDKNAVVVLIDPEKEPVDVKKPKGLAVLSEYS